MASPDSNKDSEISDLQKDVQELQLNETSPPNDSINQENGLDSIDNVKEKENSTSDRANECASIQEKSADNVETVQNEQNDAEKMEKNVKMETAQKEQNDAEKMEKNVKMEKDVTTENVQSVSQEIKTADNKKSVPVKEEFPPRRKRKSLRYINAVFFYWKKLCV